MREKKPIFVSNDVGACHRPIDSVNRIAATAGGRIGAVISARKVGIAQLTQSHRHSLVSGHDAVTVREQWTQAIVVDQFPDQGGERKIRGGERAGGGDRTTDQLLGRPRPTTIVDDKDPGFRDKLGSSGILAHKRLTILPGRKLAVVAVSNEGSLAHHSSVGAGILDVARNIVGVLVAGAGVGDVDAVDDDPDPVDMRHWGGGYRRRR